jgi:hypothetical protein
MTVALAGATVIVVGVWFTVTLTLLVVVAEQASVIVTVNV